VPKICRTAAKADSRFFSTRPVSFPKKAAARSQLRYEAAELLDYQLGFRNGSTESATGQLPKELDGQLKRIEKLAKHLRSEVAP
jgi:hypothetical protein